MGNVYKDEKGHFTDKEHDGGTCIHQGSHGSVHLNKRGEYEVRDRRGNKVGNGFSTDREAIEFLDGDFEDEDYEDDVQERVKIGSKEMTKEEWKDWANSNKDKEMAHEFMLNHASNFNMSENEMKNFLDEKPKSAEEYKPFEGKHNYLVNRMYNSSYDTPEEVYEDAKRYNLSDKEKWGLDEEVKKVFGVSDEELKKIKENSVSEDDEIRKAAKEQDEAMLARRAEKEAAIAEIQKITDRIDSYDADSPEGYMTSGEVARIKELSQKYHLTGDDLRKISKRVFADYDGYGVKDFEWKEPEKDDLGTPKDFGKKMAKMPNGKEMSLFDFAHNVTNLLSVDEASTIIAGKFGVSENDAKAFLKSVYNTEGSKKDYEQKLNNSYHNK